ncbi:MAG: hypothetical protein DMF78_04995 [Acidobacteria bacterium]|nr:MAG: hypothetical protein DMF78_04995 [Acidobacteriota bacterium]
MSEDGSGRLAVSVWVRLLKAHGLVLRELRRRVPEDLTLPQFDVLAQLQRRPAGMTSRALTRELPARGRRVAARAIPRHRRDVEALLSPLPARDLARLRRLLGRLSRSLEEAAR